MCIKGHHSSCNVISSFLFQCNSGRLVLGRKKKEKKKAGQTEHKMEILQNHTWQFKAEELHQSSQGFTDLTCSKNH